MKVHRCEDMFEGHKVILCEGDKLGEYKYKFWQYNNYDEDLLDSEDMFCLMVKYCPICGLKLEV